MSRLLTTLVAIAFAAAASTPVALAADKSDTKPAPTAEKKKSEGKKAPAKPKGEAKKGDGKKTKGEGKKKAEAPK
jgi:Spy/CpxP family protein refolding chaperone